MAGSIGGGTSTTLTSVSGNEIGADELNVEGNGTAGQALTSDGDGSMTWATLASDAITEGNSSVEVVDTGSGYITATTDGTERMRIYSSGSVQLGDGSLDWPTSTVGQLDGRVLIARDGNAGLVLANMASGTGSSRGGNILLGARGTDGTSDLAYATVSGFRASSTSGNLSSNLAFYTSDTVGTLSEVARLRASGNFAFNSGYGSVADAYGCRAWVNFDGTGTVGIDGSGNVSSITDNGLGTYTVNFSSSMPDINYATNITPGYLTSDGYDWTVFHENTDFKAIGSTRIRFADFNASSLRDVAPVYVTVFR